MIRQTSLEEISEEAEDEHDVFQQMRLTMVHIIQDKEIITNLARQVAANRVSMANISDKIEKQSVSVHLDKSATTRMRTQVLDAQAKMEQLATTIIEETPKFLLLKQGVRKTSSRPVGSNFCQHRSSGDKTENNKDIRHQNYGHLSKIRPWK